MTKARSTDAPAVEPEDVEPAPVLLDVELAYPWTDADGVEHDPDTALQIEQTVAQDLIRSGRARLASTTDSKE